MNNPISITIRPGKRDSLNLGSKNYGAVIEYLLSFGEYVISREFVNAVPDSEHLQCGVYDNKRADNIRRRLVQLLADCGWNEKQLKHGLKVRPHNDWHALASYCCKGMDILYIHVPSLGPDFELYCMLYHDDDERDYWLSELHAQGVYLADESNYTPVENFEGSSGQVLFPNKDTYINTLISALHRHKIC